MTSSTASLTTPADQESASGSAPVPDTTVTASKEVDATEQAASDQVGPDAIEGTAPAAKSVRPKIRGPAVSQLNQVKELIGSSGGSATAPTEDAATEEAAGGAAATESANNTQTSASDSGQRRLTQSQPR